MTRGLSEHIRCHVWSYSFFVLANHQLGHQATSTQSDGLVLCCLMTPGLSKDICVMYYHTFYKLANQQIRHQATHKVGCQPGDFAYGHFNLLWGLCGPIWVNILSLSSQRGTHKVSCQPGDYRWPTYLIFLVSIFIWALDVLTSGSHHVMQSLHFLWTLYLCFYLSMFGLLFMASHYIWRGWYKMGHTTISLSFVYLYSPIHWILISS